MKSYREHINTISKKYILVFSFLFVAVITVVNHIIPTLNYRLAKPYLTKNVAALIEGSMIRQSILWTSNRTVYALSADDQFKGLIENYYAGSLDANEASIIADYIEERHRRAVLQWNESIATPSYNLVIMDDGTVFGGENEIALAKSITETEWYRTMDFEPFAVCYSPVMDIELDSSPGRFICFANHVETGGRVATVLNVLDFAGLKRQYQEMESLGIDDYVMFQNDRVLYQNRSATLVDPSRYQNLDPSKEQYLSQVVETDDGLDFVVLCSMPYENFRVAFHVPKATLLLPYDNLFIIIEGLVYGLVLVVLLLVFLLNRGMLKRIRMLDGVMNGQCVPGYRKMLENPGNDEISRLVSSFEAMMKEIQENTENLIDHEKKEQQMQYALIVSAVDPHFIYNTLNTITFLASMNRNEDVVKVNNALIAVLKNRLQAKNLQPLDRVKEEKAALEQYILIQNYLTSDRIRFSFDVSHDDLELRIPKNIIQPLVENAIKHGILPNKGSDGKPLVGKIRVEVFRTSDERITLKVTDNGVGMAANVLKEYQDFCLNGSDYAFDMNHIGTKNVYLRLVHLYGEAIDFTIESAQGKGTSFTITIPNYAK